MQSKDDLMASGTNDTAPEAQRFRLDPEAVLRFTLRNIAVIVLVSLVVTLAAQRWPDAPGREILDSVFSTDSEQGIGTLYTVLQLAVTAAAAAGVAHLVGEQGRRWRWGWLGVSLCMVAVGLDEVLKLHERLNWTLEGRNPDGDLFPWVYPATALCVVLALIFVRFVLALPGKVRTLVVVAAVMFVTGAAGMEKLQGDWATSHGDGSVVTIMFNIEELMELVAIGIMLYAVLLFASTALDPETVAVEIGDHSGRGRHSRRSLSS